jgi:hypothetical protein
MSNFNAIVLHLNPPLCTSMSLYFFKDINHARHVNRRFSRRVGHKERGETEGRETCVYTVGGLGKLIYQFIAINW